MHEVSEANLDARLAALRESGWVFSSRQTYTLSRPDRDNSVRSFHSENLTELVRRVEAASVPKRPQAQSGADPLEPKPKPAVDEAMQRRLTSSKIATGLVSTSTYNRGGNS